MLPWPVILQGMEISLAMTLVLELAYALLWGVRGRHDLLLTVLVNVLTNPIVVFMVYYVRIRRFSMNTGLVTAGLETFAVVTEALLYRRFSRTIRRPWLFSLSVNAFSYAVGELINGIRGF